MKNTIRLSLLSFVMLIGSMANASTATPTDGAKDAAIYSHIISRVNEIQNMDKTSLNENDKTQLRKELKQMKKQAGGLDKKVYLSVGAVIIIILVLILLLR